MKTKNILLLTSTLAFTLLFYNQSPGFNILVFSAIFLAGFCFYKPSLLSHIKGRTLLVTTLLSALAIGLNGSELALLIWLGSICLLPVYALTSDSLITAGFHGAYSILLSWITLAQDLLSKRKDQMGGNTAMIRAGLVVLAGFITLIFFLLYQSSNPVFYNYTRNINLDFISVQWILFTLLGFLFCYGLFSPKIINYLKKFEDSLPVKINNDPHEVNTLFGKPSFIQHEYFSGILLFSMLNLLILSVNLIDSFYLFLETGKNQISLSSAVHEGIGTLLISIILAIGILLFYLRGQLNFHKPRWIVHLALLWIIQNIYLVITTLIKNRIYIQEFGLTHLRIGVYIVLIIAISGLIFTCIKILKTRTAWYLININLWAVYLILLASCFFNWGQIITEYNIHWSKEKNKSLDLIYLVRVCDNNLYQLKNLEQELNTINAKEEDKIKFRKKLEKRIAIEKLTYEYSDWPSLNYSMIRNYHNLNP